MKIRLFPFPDRLNQKWWHRLSKVLILGTAIMTCLFGIFVTWLAIDEDKIRHEIYDFERGYLLNDGTPQQVNRYNASSDFLDRAIVASREQHSDDDGRGRIFSRAIDLEEMKSVFKTQSNWEAQGMFLDATQSSKNPNFMKTWYEYSFFPEVLVLLIGPIIYLLLIGFYGTILYIAYGANPFKK